MLTHVFVNLNEFFIQFNWNISKYRENECQTTLEIVKNILQYKYIKEIVNFKYKLEKLV